MNIKKKYFLFYLFVICLISYTNNAYAQSITKAEAKQEQQKINERMVGRWWNGMEMGGITLTINADGTYFITDDMQGEETEKGKWTAIKNTITLISNTNNKTVFSYVTNADMENRSKIALRGKGCATMKGFCYFKSE